MNQRVKAATNDIDPAINKSDVSDIVNAILYAMIKSKEGVAYSTKGRSSTLACIQKATSVK